MVVNGIDTKDISVVVQGAVDNINTPKCLKSIRKYLHGARIILSTWENTDVSGLDYDEVVLNEDPGGYKDPNTDFVNNLNRQIVSTVNGLKRVSTKYCIKMRSDLIFRSNRFLRYSNRFCKREADYCVYKERITFCSYFFKRYLGDTISYIHPTPFHLSDWFAFGLTEDVLLLFDVPLAKEPDNTTYFIRHTQKYPKVDMFGASHQYAPEQYIFMESLRKKTALPRMQNIMDYTIENVDFSEKIVASNCIILNPNQISIYCGKNGRDTYKTWSKNELRLPHYIWEGLYRYDVFEEIYKKRCDPTYKLSLEGKLQRKTYLLLRRFFCK